VRNNIINSVFNSASKAGGGVDYSVFNGSQYLYVDDSDELSPRNVVGDIWAMSAKITTSGDDPEPTIISGKLNSSNELSFGMRAGNTTTSVVVMGYGSSGAGADMGTVQNGVDIILSIIIDYNQNKSFAYINNAFTNIVHEADLTGFIDGSEDEFFIGGFAKGEYPKHIGEIKDVRVFHGNPQPSYANLVAGTAVGTEIAWWNLEEGLTDKSGNGYNLTPVGF
jgi:hypothetical protein